MANTYTQLLIHSVFAVKYRKAVLEKEWRQEVFGYIGASLEQMGHKCHIVNGVEDHVHLLFGMKPTLSISDTMRDIKANSSKWLNETGKLETRFHWQDGYSAFAVSRTHKDAVYRYIQNQEAHHSKTTFRNEYLTLLKKNEIPFDERWIFESLQ